VENSIFDVDYFDQIIYKLCCINRTM